MKSILVIALLALTSLSMAQTTSQFTQIQTCSVTKVFAVNEAWPKISLKENDPVTVSYLSEYPEYLAAQLGKLSIDSVQDDEVSPKISLVGSAYSIMPNSGEWLVVLEVVNQKGLLNFIKTDGNRQSFQKLAELKCE